MEFDTVQCMFSPPTTEIPITETGIETGTATGIGEICHSVTRVTDKVLR